MYHCSMYRQCLLIKNTTQQIAWIEERLAVRGRYVRIHADNGWKVESVYSRQPREYVEWKSRDHKTAFASIL